MATSDRYTYRHLRPADVPLLKDLLRAFGEAFEDIGTYQHTVPSDTYLSGLLAKLHFIAVAAMDGNTVVGGLAAYQLDKFEQDRREVYIYDLAILEAHRHQHHRHPARHRRPARRLRHLRPGRPRRHPGHRPLRVLGTKETAHHFDIAVRRSARADTTR